MKCKYCGADLVDGKPFCPSCGKEAQPAAEENAAEQNLIEETEIPETPAVQEIAETAETVEAAETPAAEIKEGGKATPGKIALAVAAGVVLLAVLVALIISGLDGNLLSPIDSTEPPQQTTPVETVPEGTIPPDGNPDDVTCKGTYTVSDDEAIAARNDIVATMGDTVLTNGQLQIFYWEEVFAFLQEYGTTYAAYFGLDYTQPLDTQLCETGDISLTWQQYFLQCALNNWSVYQALDLEGKTSDFELPADYVEERDAMAEELKEAAVTEGYADAEEMIRESYGAGPMLEDFLHFARVNNEGYLYFAHVYDNIVLTYEDVDAYFTENETDYAESGITRDSGKYVDVRHVLLMPEDENATTDELGYPVYSEEAWEACRIAAEALYQQWQEDGDLSEDSFAQLAMDHSEDGNASQGGLYSDVYQGQMVEAFDNWCFDESRQYGDHGLVKTEFGYHLMYFVGSADIWYEIAKEDLLTEKSSTVVPSAMENHPMEVDYSAIKLGLRDLTK